jgi:hypothetical protein
MTHSALLACVLLALQGWHTDNRGAIDVQAAQQCLQKFQLFFAGDMFQDVQGV